MAFVTYDDVATTLGRPISDETERAQVDLWIGDAELLIRARLGDLDDLDTDVLTHVVREAVAMRVRNPDGKQSERIDDYSYQRAPEAARPGGISILDEWWDLLTPADAVSGAFTIRPAGTAGYATPSGLWSEVEES